MHTAPKASVLVLKGNKHVCVIQCWLQEVRVEFGVSSQGSVWLSTPLPPISKNWEHLLILTKGQLNSFCFVVQWTSKTDKYQMFGCGRERLARLKSSVNLKLVRRYKDRHGRTKVKGGPNLTESAAYPINLGLKARPLLLAVFVFWSRWEPWVPRKAFLCT